MVPRLAYAVLTRAYAGSTVAYAAICDDCECLRCCLRDAYATQQLLTPYAPPLRRCDTCNLYASLRRAYAKLAQCKTSLTPFPACAWTFGTLKNAYAELTPVDSCLRGDCAFVTLCVDRIRISPKPGPRRALEVAYAASVK